MTAAHHQRAWRAKHAGSITVHLSAEDAATLDAIAIALYTAAQHNPAAGDVARGIRPSRPEAIRWLCAEWRKQYGTPTHLIPLRDKLSAFWRAETAWRQVKNSDTRSKRPTPPWPAPAAPIEAQAEVVRPAAKRLPVSTRKGGSTRRNENAARYLAERAAQESTRSDEQISVYHLASRSQIAKLRRWQLVRLELAVLDRATILELAKKQRPKAIAKLLGLDVQAVEIILSHASTGRADRVVRDLRATPLRGKHLAARIARAAQITASVPMPPSPTSRWNSPENRMPCQNPDGCSGTRLPGCACPTCGYDG